MKLIKFRWILIYILVILAIFTRNVSSLHYLSIGVISLIYNIKSSYRILACIKNHWFFHFNKTMMVI